MLAQRIITAIILGIATIISIFYLPPIGFNLLSLLVVALAIWEFSGFFNSENYKVRIGFLLIFLLVAMVTIRFLPVVPILLVGVLWWLLVPYVLWRYVENEHNYFTHLVCQELLGVLVFVPCWLSLVVVREKFGVEFLFCLLAIVCATDIGAYFTGMFWGKRLLVPRISPKKTFEGVLGGVFAALLVAITAILSRKFGVVRGGATLFNFSYLSNISFLLLAIVTCLWSIIGDLFESMLKRQAGIKDSGRLLPGHGGIYDRIDSLTAAAPIFALGLLLI